MGLKIKYEEGQPQKTFSVGVAALNARVLRFISALEIPISFAIFSH
jgi:hypothetical protein